MLHFHGFLSSCIKIHKSSFHIPGFAYTWDAKKDRFTALKRRSWIGWLALLSFLSVSNAFAVWKYNVEQDITKLSLGTISLTGLTVASWLLWFVSVKAKVCVQFLNGLLEMENQLEQKQLLRISDKGSYGGLMCGLLLLTDIITPWFLGIGAGLNPCSPPNLLVPFFQSRGSSDSQFHISIITKLTWITLTEFLAVSFINGIFWKAITESGDLSCVHVLVGCICQSTILKALKRSVGNLGGFDILTYRQMQILSSLFNESHVGILFVGLSGVSVLLTCFLHVLFQIVTTSSIEIPLPVAIWCVILVAQMVTTILFMFGKAGSLHSLHEENMQVAKMKIASSFEQKRKWRIEQRQLIRSCAPVKVAFGISNFVEKETPLNFLDFSINRFVDMLLLE
ncbi:unnamed protein product [Orchesella dallaii]|uniref:Gustatory receptor n=1 Tax=Orchesella dallaii TaxID=48710 RepID=A0ABP1PLB2_9HEXA